MRRGGRKRKNKVIQKFKLLGANINGISSKLHSFEHVIQTVDPSVFTIQETKVRRANGIKFESAKKYKMFQLIRKESQGGGLVIGAKTELEPVVISEGNDQVEIIVIEIKIKEQFRIRIINAYGPQECSILDKKEAFWAHLQTQVDNAVEAEAAVLIQMDANAILGDTIINGDPNKMNKNGELFGKFLSANQSLFLLNKSDKCQGVITRRRQKGDKLEESVIDFVVVCEKLHQYLDTMKIDEARQLALTSYLKKGKSVDSDHMTISAEFNIEYRRKPPPREEIFNFRNGQGLKAFKNI